VIGINKLEALGLDVEGELGTEEEGCGTELSLYESV